MSNIFHANAERLVERIQTALVAGRRDVAVKLALDGIKGNVPISDEQFTDALAQPSNEDITDAIWRIAGQIFDGQPARWRVLIGKLVKVAGKKRALDVVTDCQNQQTQDPSSYIGAAIAQGDRNPEWRLSEEELCSECEGFGIATQGKSRPELEAALKGARRRGGQFTTESGLGRDFHG